MARASENNELLEQLLIEERELWDRVYAAIDLCAADISSIWHQGDGFGGGFLEVVASRLRETGYCQCHTMMSRPPNQRASAKKKIPNQTRKQVMERDMYRCQHCGTHKDLSIDHIHPESKGGAADVENLQVLCRSCNSRKGVSVAA